MGALSALGAFDARCDSNPVSRFQRRQVEATIERLIDLLDWLDPDPDIEDDDPAGDPLDRGEFGDDLGISLDRPVYGIDQSVGPLNFDSALLNYRRRLGGLAA